MKFLISGSNIKVFGRAIHTLSKIGEDLYFESTSNCLCIKTVNSSRSAFANYVFQEGFFLPVDLNATSINSAENDNSIKCKVTAKSCLTAFKSLNNLEKTVQKCKISIDVDSCRFIFQFYCHHGILKTHKLTLIECDSLSAVFTRDSCQNNVKAHVRLFSDAVANFQQQQEEISLIVTEDNLTLKNYSDDEPDPSKIIRTELKLLKEEFDSYNVRQLAEITFCLKELRAILSFAEATSIPVSLYFDTAGRPIIFTLGGDAKFEASFVLATLASDSQGFSYSQANNIQQQAVHKTVHELNNTAEPNNSISIDIMRDKSENNMDTQTAESTQLNYYTNDVSNGAEHLAAVQPKTPTAVGEQQQFEIHSPVLPIMRGGRPSLIEEVDDSEENLIPGTPPSKKFRSIFFGLSQATLHDSQRPIHTVLAEDTDDEG